MIAEAAYYKAENVAFPGNDTQDWLEAKSEIIALVYGDMSVKNNSTRKPQCNYFKFINLNINYTPQTHFAFEEAVVAFKRLLLYCCKKPYILLYIIYNDIVIVTKNSIQEVFISKLQ